MGVIENQLGYPFSPLCIMFPSGYDSIKPCPHQAFSSRLQREVELIMVGVSQESPWITRNSVRSMARLFKKEEDLEDTCCLNDCWMFWFSLFCALFVGIYMYATVEKHWSHVVDADCRMKTSTSDLRGDAVNIPTFSQHNRIIPSKQVPLCALGLQNKYP